MVTLLRSAIMWFGGRRIRGRLAAGDYCSIKSEVRFGIVKILAAERRAIHVRIYKEKFSQRLGRVEPAGLTLGTIDDPDGFGIGHLPLSWGTFASWLPVRIQNEPVTDDELVWVGEWRKSKGGVWG